MTPTAATRVLDSDDTVFACRWSGLASRLNDIRREANPRTRTGGV